MAEFDTKNAIIKSVNISSTDYETLSAWLHLDYGGTEQGFGGYMLYAPNIKQKQKNVAGHFIWRTLEVVGVIEWSALAGKTIRVKANHSGVYAIGHIVNDTWFCPSEEFKAL